MIWGNKRLQNLIDIGMISGTYEGSVNPASINLRLGHTFLKPKKDQNVLLGEEMIYERYEIKDGQRIFIMPGEFMLATTIEAIDVPVTAAAFVQGERRAERQRYTRRRTLRKGDRRAVPFWRRRQDKDDMVELLRRKVQSFRGDRGQVIRKVDAAWLRLQPAAR